MLSKYRCQGKETLLKQSFSIAKTALEYYSFPMKNKTKKPMVTVIITTFNRGGLLLQNYPNIETIVIDDGSTNDTAKKFFPYLDRITYIK